MLDSTIKSQIEMYKKSEKDEFFLKELATVEANNDEQELYERFYTDLEFGTGGIRGIIGAGINRLNTLVVQRVAEGWARYLKSEFSQESEIKVVIAYDSRNFSVEFSRTVSEILTAHGIKVYCYPAPRPTPQLSFTIRQLKAHSGLVITASHNPPKYNGLKIYWKDGAQVISPYDRGIMDEIAKAKTMTDFETLDLSVATERGLYEELGAEADEKFRNYVSGILEQPEIFQGSDDYKVVYTPLHGTGAYHMEALMQKYNIKGIIEPSQKQPDGTFPTVKFPNPEEAEALNNAIETAKKTGASLVVATDPDADRVGLAEKDGDDFVCISGNQIGALLLDYILKFKKEKLQLKNDSVFVNTIVTTRLQEKIAASYGVETYKSFTGFKNIAEAMAKIEAENKNYVFSCEESYGYLASMDVRDKDGISISLLCIEMALFYHTEHLRLLDRLEQIYKEHGYHLERSVNKVLEGASGKEKITQIMEKMRTQPPKTIGEEKIASIHDYQEKVVKSVDGAVLSQIEGFRENSNVLIFTTEEGNEICMRPSGTEPKIKFYFLYSAEKNFENIDIAKSHIKSLVKKAEADLENWLV